MTQIDHRGCSERSDRRGSTIPPVAIRSVFKCRITTWLRIGRPRRKWSSAGWIWMHSGRTPA